MRFTDLQCKVTYRRATHKIASDTHNRHLHTADILESFDVKSDCVSFLLTCSLVIHNVFVDRCVVVDVRNSPEFDRYVCILRSIHSLFSIFFVFSLLLLFLFLCFSLSLFEFKMIYVYLI